jgi:hypothetical protein
VSIETSDFTTLVGEAWIADLEATGETVTEAVRRVEEDHPGYNYSYSTEIRCDAWACSEYIEIEAGRNNAAEEAYAAHRAVQVDTVLALSTTRADLIALESPEADQF